MRDSEHTLKPIENLYSKGDFLGVIKKSSQNIKQQKHQSISLFLRGLSYFQIGEYSSANADFEAAKSQGIDNNNILELILSSKRNMNFIDAIKKFKKGDTSKELIFSLGNLVSFLNPQNLIWEDTEKAEILPELYLILMRTNGPAKPSVLARRTYALIKSSAEYKSAKDFILSKSEISRFYDCVIALADLELLVNVLKYHVCTDPDIEYLTKFIRKFYLLHSNETTFEPKLVKLLSSIAIQNQINEYVYDVSEEELELVSNLRNAIKSDLENDVIISEEKLLKLSLYSNFDGLDLDKKLPSEPLLEDLLTELFENKKNEQKNRQSIPTDPSVKNNVSLKVQEQYEDHPYPRYKNLGFPLKPIPLEQILARKRVDLNSTKILTKSNLEVLIAGCGTGMQPISALKTIENIRIDACDLSISSLSFAQRKTKEMGLSNIKYFQRDILNLGDDNKKYDYIECCGVLHHLEDPQLGLEILSNKLNPGGIMLIGLYSSIARRKIKTIQSFIKDKKVSADTRTMRYFREYLKTAPIENINLLNMEDFYSTSMFRDLLFHEQEHTFDLLEIKHLLNQLNLKFCGFDISNDLVTSFIKQNSNQLFCLDAWADFESSNPDTFIGMYQFFCQRKLHDSKIF